MPLNQLFKRCVFALCHGCCEIRLPGQVIDKSNYSPNRSVYISNEGFTDMGGEVMMTLLFLAILRDEINTATWSLLTTFVSHSVYLAVQVTLWYSDFNKKGHTKCDFH